MYLFIHRQRPPPIPVLSKSESFMEFHIQIRPPSNPLKAAFLRLWSSW